MSYYQCDRCKEYFDEDDMDETTIDLEDYNGVGSMFSNHHYQKVGCCPNCGSVEIGEVSDYELVEEIYYWKNKYLTLKKELKKHD